MQGGVISGASTALSTTKAVIALTAGDAAQNGVRLERLLGKIDTISGCAVVHWYLARDAAGDHPVTAQADTSIVTGKTTATDGGTTEELGFRWQTLSGGLAKTVYVVVWLDAGTCNLLPEVIWTTG